MTMMVALIFVGLVAVGIISLLGMANHQTRMTRYRIERENVYYTAEAGVDQVFHWFTFPGEYTANTSLFTQDTDSESYFTDTDGDNITDTSVFEIRLGGTETLIDDSTNEDLIVFTNAPINTSERTRVTELTLELPPVGSPSDHILVVNSTASDVRGVERHVRVTLSAEPPFPLVIPAAIIDHDALLGTDGQFNVHWGEAWAKGDLTLPNLPNIPRISEDPFALLRAEGYVLMNNGRFADGTNNGSATEIPFGEPNYYYPWEGSDPDLLNIEQHWVDPPEFPYLEYDFWRTAALTRGLFFSTDASGNLYYGTVENDSTLINSNEFFEIIDQTSDLTVNTGTPGDQDLPEPNIIFIDTVDGNPPAPDGSNFADISLAGGGGIFTRGIFYIAGNLAVGGAGNPPEVWIQDPDLINTGVGIEILENIRHMGVIYTDGTYSQQGNQITYGAIIAKRGFDTGGTPNVFYDARLANGLAFPFNSLVSVALWEEIPINPIN